MPKNDDGEFELILGNRQLLSVFFIVVILLGVFFTDANNGIVVGRYGTILRTTDGGVTWTPEFSDTHSDLFGVFFSDADTGTVVGGEGTILRTR